MGNEVCQPKEQFLPEEELPQDDEYDRLPPFLVKLRRSGPHWNSIGIVLSPDHSPTSLTIEKIRAPSLLSEWNYVKQRTAQTQVRPGDRIIATNGQPTTANRMMSMIQNVAKGDELTLLIEPCAEKCGTCSDSDQNGPSCVPDPSRAPDRMWRDVDLFVNSRPLYDETPTYAERPRYERRREPELKQQFETLEISDRSSHEAIREQYKRLCRQWHPDKNPDNKKQATEKFQAIATAYNVIKMTLHL